MKTQAWPRTLPLFLVWLSCAFVLEAIGQPWHSEDAIPVFRGTEAQDRAFRKLVDSSACLGRLNTLGNAARNFAYDHGGHLPQTWSDFTNRIADPGVLYCPADPWRPAQTNWAQVDLASISYEILAPGADTGAASQTYIRCEVHGNTVTTHGVRVAPRPYDKRGFPAASSDRICLPIPALLAARESAISLQCLNNLKELGLAARSFATDHADFMPSSFAEIADALDSLQTLVCPSDLLRTAAASLAELNASNITYRLDAPGINANVNPIQRFITCPIHDNHVDTNGSGAQGTNRYPPRLIIGHPLSWTVEPGRPVELAVLTGDPSLGPFRFQWRRQQPFDSVGDPFTNTVVLADATNQTYRIPTASAGDEGYYDVIVSDGHGGYQLSYLAYVRVEPVTNVNSQLEWEAIACFNNLKQIGLAARMFATVNPDQWPLSYRDLMAYLGWPLTLCCPGDPNRTVPSVWEAVDFADLSYTLETGLPVEPGTNVLAACKVHGYWTQSDGTVNVGEAPPAIFAHPASQATFAGRAVSLTLGTMGDLRSYRWFKNDEAITGETNDTLTLPGLAVTNTASYHAIVSNPWGSATSHVAVVTVHAIPTPWLQWAVTSPGVEFALSLAGPAGVECRLETSSDLKTWSPLTTNVLTDAPFMFPQRIDALPAVRFYRATLR
jgi:hypothetical protein